MPIQRSQWLSFNLFISLSNRNFAFQAKNHVNSRTTMREMYGLDLVPRYFGLRFICSVRLFFIVVYTCNKMPAYAWNSLICSSFVCALLVSIAHAFVVWFKQISFCSHHLMIIGNLTVYCAVLDCICVRMIWPIKRFSSIEQMRAPNQIDVKIIIKWH